MKWHIAVEHLCFKSRREEWAVRVWRDVRYHPPKKVKPDPLTLAKLIPDGEGIKEEA